MKKLLVFILVISVLASLPVFASELGDQFEPPEEGSSEVVEVLPIGALVPDELSLTDVSVLQAVAPVGPSDATGLKKILLELLGEYDPVIIQYQYQNNNGTYSYLRETQLDWPWLASAVIFLAVLWCVLKMGSQLLWKL